MLRIIRGLSGSGKTTLASQLSNQDRCNYWEADMYFVDLESGEYEFNPQKLTEAYKWCWQVANDDLIYYGKVIVSNTFTTWKEILPYVQRAQRMDILIDIIETDTPWARNPQKCADKNQHAVPLAEIKRQLSRWEEIPTGIFNAKTLLEKMK